MEFVVKRSVLGELLVFTRLVGNQDARLTFVRSREGPIVGGSAFQQFPSPESTVCFAKTPPGNIEFSRRFVPGFTFFLVLFLCRW